MPALRNANRIVSITSSFLAPNALVRASSMGMALHREASEEVQLIKDRAFEMIIDAIKSSKHVTEFDVQQFILSEFTRENSPCENFLPLVTVNEHAANPHFEVAPIEQNLKGKI